MLTLETLLYSLLEKGKLIQQEGGFIHAFCLEIVVYAFAEYLTDAVKGYKAGKIESATQQV